MSFIRKIKNKKLLNLDQSYKRIFLHGTIRITFYLIIPFIIIFILSVQGIMSFSPNFIMTIIFTNIIGLIITIIRYIPSKDTILRNIIGVIIAIYNGFYLFYFFGGFTKGETLGNYYIKTESLEGSLGLQFLAGILLFGALINSMYYVVKTLKLKKFTKQNQKRKEIKYLKIIKSLKYTKLSLNSLLIGFILSVALSGLGLSILLNNKYFFFWDEGSDLFDYSDDSIQITAYFDLTNLGMYSVLDVILDVDIYTLNTSDISPGQIFLPDNTKIGEIENMEYPIFPRGSINRDEKIVIDVFTIYVQGLIMFDANLKLLLNFTCIYATIRMSISTEIEYTWTKLVP